MGFVRRRQRDDGEIGTWILRNALKQRDVRLFEMVVDDVSAEEE